MIPTDRQVSALKSELREIVGDADIDVFSVVVSPTHLIVQRRVHPRYSKPAEFEYTGPNPLPAFNRACDHFADEHGLQLDMR